MSRERQYQERKLVLACDHRRKYGVSIVFQVERSEHIGGLENVTLLVDDGTLATIEPCRVSGWEGGKRYQIAMAAFPTASKAEEAGLRTAQALLLTAISLNFGLRLNYHTHEPHTVFDRTISKGSTAWLEGCVSQPQHVVLNELTKTLAVPLHDRRLLLSMELFVASSLESNDRAKFVMAVSALEPLAVQESLGSGVESVIDDLSARLATTESISRELVNSLQGRLRELKRESVRQALKRLCAQWLPNDRIAWAQLDKAYSLRSEMLHAGRPHDLDLILSDETLRVSVLLRRIFQQAFGYTFKARI